GELDAHLALALEDFDDLAFHVLEDAFLDLDPVALLERRLLDDLAGRGGAALLRPDLRVDDPLDLPGRPRGRGAVDRAPREVADAGRLAEQVQDAVVELHLGHDVAGVELLLLGDPLALLDLDHLLRRDEDLAEVLLQALDLDLALDGFLDRLLAARLH